MKHLYALLICFSVAIVGCTEFEDMDLPEPTEEMKKPIYPVERALINGGDVVSVKFVRHPEFDTHGFVEMDGTFTLPLVGPIAFANKTTSELREELIKAFSKELRNVDIVITTEKPDAMVFVTGQTRAGGPMPYRTNMTVAMAVAASAPDTVKGDLKQTILVRRDECRKMYLSYLVNADFSNGIARNVYLMPGDVVVIPRKGIALAGDVVQMYIRDIVPPQMTVGYMFSHEVHSEAGR